MIDDMASLKQAMEQMDSEDPAVAQAAKDRAAQILSDAKLNFSKMAELIEQRQLLLRPMIVTRIKRMDQPGMLGDAAFRDTGNALRKEGQSFRQIAEAIEYTDRLAPRYVDLVQNSEPLHQAASEPDAPAWRRALAVVANILLYPLRHRIRSLVIALIVILPFYALRGFVALGQQVSGYFDDITAVRQGADKAVSSVSTFIHEQILRQSKEAAAPPRPPAAIPSPSAVAPSPPPSATPAAPPATVPAPSATAPAPSANESAPPAPSSAAPAPPPAAPAGPPVSTPRRKGAPPSKSATNCGPAREDRYPWSCCCAPSGDDRPRALEDVIPERMRRNSRMGGPCVGGVGGCYWGGGQY
ncbi:hypothetical protein [Bradyrhizobium sp.]|jgi:hypothetical protein|uniref:hypothetical protein n=1 Tax=Bradyrhizobium sp. TaxID=376 RepID=UPI003BB2208F